LAIFAEVDGAFSAVVARTARDGRVEGDAVTDPEASNILTDGLDDACGFVSHDQGGDPSSGATVKTVDIAAADAAGFDSDQQVAWSAGRIGHFDDLEFFYFCQ
jgi:hypothetical protein